MIVYFLIEMYLDRRLLPSLFIRTLLKVLLIYSNYNNMEPGHCLIKQMIDEVAMERGSFDVYLNPDKAWAFTVKN